MYLLEKNGQKTKKRHPYLFSLGLPLFRLSSPHLLSGHPVSSLWRPLLFFPVVASSPYPSLADIGFGGGRVWWRSSRRASPPARLRQRRSVELPRRPEAVRGCWRPRHGTCSSWPAVAMLSLSLLGRCFLCCSLSGKVSPCGVSPSMSGGERREEFLASSLTAALVASLSPLTVVSSTFAC
jgi:hypothetical protein